MNNQLIKLENQCRSLPYTNAKQLDEGVFIKTYHILEEAFRDFGFANVLGFLSEIWSFEKAVPFLVKVGKTKKDKEVHTIGVYYHRGYNGGVERVNAQLMSMWVNMGFRVLFFSEEPYNSNDFPYPDSVRRIIIPKRSDMTARLISLQNHCLNENVDLFVNHDWTNQGFIWECMLMNMLYIPYINYCHGHYAWCFSLNGSFTFQPMAFQLCDMIVALSETSAGFYQMCGCNTFLVNNPIPDDLLDNKTVSGLNSNRILMVGRLSEEKYPIDALKIMQIVHAKLPDTILDIVGDGECINEVKLFIEENELRESVILHGLKSYYEISEYYKNASCVLFTSKMEGYPMVVLETKAYGIPLVMYDLPYLSLIKDQKGILTAPINDFDKMADNVISIIENDGVRQRLGKEQRDSFEELSRYDIQNVWNSIFSMSSGNKNSKGLEGFFDPSDLDESYKLIFPDLFRKIYEGFEKQEGEFKQSKDYRIGKAILFCPRELKRVLRSVKNELRHGKK